MIDRVEALLTTLYLGDGAPRDEERKKAREVADLLALLAQVQPQPAPRGKARVLVDGAAGHGYVGLCAAALLGWRRVVAIERDARRVERLQRAAALLDVPLELSVSMSLETGVPEGADVVVALHACGSATDALLEGATRAHARWILCAPCCYGVAIPGFADALEEARHYEDATLATRHATLKIDARRLATLRNARYEAHLKAFTAPTVTPHNHLFQARRGGTDHGHTKQGHSLSDQVV